MSEQLDGREILAYLSELAEELPSEASVELIVVGGSMLALRGLRHATRDVDSARPLEQKVQGAAARVAQRHDLAVHWLNADAAPFAGPLGDDIAESAPVLDHPRLRVHLATPEAVFLMKLYADRPQDHQDLVMLWPLCGFSSPQEAADRCNDAYEFIGPRDEHLVHRVEAIAAAAATPDDV